ncbi:MAG: rod shape-determining protein RodA [Acidimicrobiales bacterium]
MATTFEPRPPAIAGPGDDGLRPVRRWGWLRGLSSAEAPWRHVDLALVVSVLAIAGLGVVMVYSATRGRLREAGADEAYYLNRQAAFMAIGVVVMIAMTLVDYRVLRHLAPRVYVGMIGVLLLVLTPLGSANRGQQASFEIGGFQVQPSELAKVGVIVCCAAYAGSRRTELDARGVATMLALAGTPLALIYLQPDLGTALVFVAIAFALLVVAGARLRHLAFLAAAGTLAIGLVIHFGVLQQYQLDRLGAFLDPAGDTRRSAYNLNQSKTAIGSGGLTGKGLFNGSQTNLSYVPEQHTDFIFTAVGEQLGLVGSGLLLALFGVVVWRTWRAATLSRDVAGTLICAGVLAMFVFQIFENVGMTMGIMPITGIPLPLMSYGGSSAIATFAAVGLVLNVHMRRFS